MFYRLQTLRGRRAAILKLNGLLDMDAIIELREAVDAVLQQGIYEIIVDLEDVGIISSAGWGVFISKLAVIERAQGHLRFAAMRPEVQQIFELLGLSRSSSMAAHDSVQAAMQASVENVPT